MGEDGGEGTYLNPVYKHTLRNFYITKFCYFISSLELLLSYVLRNLLLLHLSIANKHNLLCGARRSNQQQGIACEMPHILCISLLSL